MALWKRVQLGQCSLMSVTLTVFELLATELFAPDSKRCAPLLLAHAVKQSFWCVVYILMELRVKNKGKGK